MDCRSPDTKFYDFTPYSPTGGTYRYLVKPAQSGATSLIGSYTAKNGNTKEYIIEQNSIAAAKYKHYKVDGGITEKTHTLQVGDFYLKDGSLVANDAMLTDAQAAACIGIVLKAGRNLDGNWNDDCDYMLKGTTIQMSTIHGYVLALDDANNGKNCQWGPYDTIVGTNTEQYTGFYGYTNTNTIKAFATKNGNDLETAFPATYYATEGYEKTNPAPDNTSGWFLPSAGQCKFWLDNKAVLQGSVRKVTGNDGYNWKPYYWSSSEYSDNPAYYAWCLYFGYGYVYDGYKAYNFYVRSVLAF